MNNIRVFNGSNILADYATKLYPCALEYYGRKYRSVVDKTIEKSVLYGWTNETANEIVCNILNIECADKNEKICSENVDGFYFLNLKSRNNLERVSVVKIYDDFIFTTMLLCHELYGHGVISMVKPFKCFGNYLYIRNGISIEQRINGERKLINNMLNEGITQYITEEIMKIYGYNCSNLIYRKEVQIAKILFDTIGKEKMLKILVESKGCISSLFNTDDRDDFYEFSNKIDHKLDVSSDIEAFVKRYGEKYEIS